MMSIEEASIRFQVTQVDLAAWVRQQWVKPLREGETWYFDDCDLARLQLICDLRELEVGDEALPLVLSLLDQLYATRTALARYRHLLDQLPEPTLRELESSARRSRVVSQLEGKARQPLPLGRTHLCPFPILV